ncbi:PH domain-containing protein [Rhodococcus sp. BP-252]|uniref:YdbS-like PH domain-containing protein n=1 Tax=Rhodococcoides kyotonense TaxID=398843 RepID=A0A177YME0_9NOCA|nr:MULTISPECIES: PH domain-containing protein [Rhodococcus]MBY6412482.1 PH domain-containing protein [Rhodococcus sp. BP-320]MBY6417062.1 PH domain-containing protein [Rhodococcus sp. BP-321]MBY6421975.1 PH domain-containing protein [Rhodococcus sp. BP-324]MBY6427086.1 PH domain-containing protein [Rhodococcus sp. BP-323]MBY6432415.1 PH domain-containing protein [Rhodococcus sp. BP-322]
MGYPQDALADEEELLLHHHPHWKMLVLPALTFIAVTAVAGFAIGVISARLDGTAATVASIVTAVIWVIVVGWRSVAPLISWQCTHFIVTDRRVLVRQGVITHSGIDIPMGRISNVQFRHGLVDRMLGTGTLIIASASDDPLEFDDIPQVQRVHSLLYQQVFDSLEVRRDAVYADEPNDGDDVDGAVKRGWRAGRRR